MKHFDVVQKAGIFNDELISIDVPEETDIKQIIQHSLQPIRDELEQINENMEGLREEIMNAKSDIRKSERDIQILKKNIADSAQQHRFLSAELKQQLEAFQQKNQMTVEALQKQNLKAMDDLKKNFSSEFIKFCRDDIWGYFDMLKKYTEKVSGDAEKINSNIATLRSVQETTEKKINKRYRGSAKPAGGGKREFCGNLGNRTILLRFLQSRTAAPRRRAFRKISAHRLARFQAGTNEKNIKRIWNWPMNRTLK